MAAVTWDNGMTVSFADTVSVVIGSSEGIGQAIAIALARAGATVIVGGRERGRMDATLKGIEQAGGAGHFEAVDVREPDAITAFAAAVTASHGAPAVLINSMGGSLVKPMTEVEVDEWDNLHNTHVRGTFLVCQAFAPAMTEAGYGKIVNLSSPAAMRATKLRGTYGVAKAGLNQLTRVLAAEWGPLGIRVNALAPSTTRTPRALAGFERDPGREADVVSRTPLGRIADPDDMVGPALFLASPLSDFVTGQVLLVDGGMMTGR